MRFTVRTSRCTAPTWRFYSGLEVGRVDPSVAQRLRCLPEPYSGAKDQFVVAGRFQFTDLPKYYGWERENERRAKNGLYPLPSRIRVTLLEVFGAEPAELDEWLTYFERVYNEILVEPFTTRVCQEWPDVNARATVESREIASTLL